ncbi:beta-ketoacyl-ACP synthase III [Candidatus Margulisiibacteriota bacterium]
MKSIGIIGCGKSVPPKIVTNNDFVKLGLDTSDDWITDRTGIKERRIAGNDTASSDLGFEAAKAALENAGLKPEDIDLIIVATTSPDYQVFPSTACILQNKLGLRNVGAFDVSAACTGFNYALTTAAQYIISGYAKNVLVIGVDCLSKYLNWKDRSTCVLFGDGAGAVILSDVKSGYGLMASKLYADGSAEDILKVRAGGSRNPVSKERLDKNEQYIYMDGKAVFKVAISKVLKAIKDILKEADLESGDIDHFIMHQANLRIIEYVREKLELRPEQLVINLNKYGNTSAASIPIALTEALAEGRVKDGDKLLFVGFGAGFTWGVNILRWGGRND